MTKGNAVTVADFRDMLNIAAPFDTAEPWDNVGLLVGREDAVVTRVMTALDITSGVVKQAAEWNAQLIVSHHPVIFKPVSCLKSDQPAYLLAQHGLSAICAHTNFDRAQAGVNDMLAAMLQLKDVHPSQDEKCRIGEIGWPVASSDFAAAVKKMTGAQMVQYIDGGRMINTVAVCAGAGGDELSALSEADALVTGELKHNEWLEAAATGKTVIAAGHYATEVRAAQILCDILRTAFPHVEIRAAKENYPYSVI